MRVTEADEQAKMTRMKAPRDVFTAGCAVLADAFAEDGFVYRRSHPKLVRKIGDFTEEVRFRTSWHNATGELTQLWVDVVLASRRIAAWRANHPADVVASYVGGTGLANLMPPETDWNLAAPSTRARTLRAAEHAIRTVGLPYLALFRDPIALEQALLAADLRGMSPDELIDPLVCFGGIDAGARYAAAVVARHPDMAKRIVATVKRVRRTGKLGAGTTNYFDDFAARLVRLGVPFP